MRQFIKHLSHLREAPAARRASVYLLVGLTLSGLCLWLFAHIAEDVLEGDPIVIFDAAIAAELHHQATHLSTAFYLTVSWFGAVRLQSL